MWAAAHHERWDRHLRILNETRVRHCAMKLDADIACRAMMPGTQQIACPSTVQCV